MSETLENKAPNDAEESSSPDERFQMPGGVGPLVYYITTAMLFLLGWPYFRLRHKNTHRIPKSGPVLFVSNHASHLDPPLLGISTRRRVAFLAKEELFANKLFAWYISALGAFPIKRGGGDREALRVAIGVLKAGYPLLMFPEGNRTRDGKLGEAKTGVAMLINRVPEATIVPLRIDGSFNAWPPGASFPRPRNITIHVGEPFKLSDLGELPTQRKQLYQKIGEEIMTRISSAGPPITG